jgi:methylenetetrahydrofolate reductase (NADPH)
MMASALAPPIDDTHAARISALAAGASFELSPRDHAAIDQCRDLLSPGTSVYVSYVPGDTYHASVAAAVRLARSGFRPVPHVAARYLASFTQLHDYLARASGEAGVGEMLVVAGDVDRPLGSFQTSQQILQTGLFQKHGVTRIGLAGYPEGHPKIGNAALDDALRAKLAVARRSGLSPYIVTQFCFEAPPIIQWLGRLADDLADVPVVVGLAGPASIATLAKFAVRCGIGNSIKTLVRGQTSVARLLVEAGPEQIVCGLARAVRNGTPIARLHFFTFGGVARTAKWSRAVARGDIEFLPDGDHFRVIV